MSLGFSSSCIPHLHKKYSHWSINRNSTFQEGLIISNCGESPLAVRQWEYSWILSRFFLQVYSFTNLALTCTPKYCMVKKIWQTSHDWYDMHCVLQLTLKLCYVSFFIASDILNAIGTGNSGARKLVMVIFEQRKKPLKKQTGRRVRVTQGM